MFEAHVQTLTFLRVRTRTLRQKSRMAVRRVGVPTHRNARIANTPEPLQTAHSMKLFRYPVRYLWPPLNAPGQAKFFPTISKPDTAPSPILLCLDQASLYRIVLDILSTPYLLLFIPHVGVPVIVLPEIARPTQDLVCFSRAIALPIPKQDRHRNVPGLE